LYFPPKVGIKEPLLPGIPHPRIKRIGECRVFQKGAEQTELARVKRIGQCRVFQERVDRTGQNPKNRPVPGISKKIRAESKEPVVPGISKLLNRPNLVFIIDLPKNK
jgi:hypothetical protein